MRVPISWLKEYVKIAAPLDQLADRMTLAGLEVESIERIGDWWDRAKIVVAEVQEVRPHPNADRLVLANVAYGGSAVEQCVTGAPNLFPFKGAGRVSLKVAFAMEGAELYDGHQEGFVKTRLKPGKIRGIPSRAMVCSEKELGISNEHEGILFLPDDAPVGTPLADYLGDTIFDVTLTPNLARCLSVIGVAREVAALTGVRVRYPETGWRADGPAAADLARVTIEDPDLCARYIATLIQGVQIGPGPKWMQDRLRKAGMRPINNIVDITNYVMLEWGQPLHAFDYDKLLTRASGGDPTIIVRRSMPGETMTTLDGVDRVFAEDTLLICDTAGPIAVAGVMGGLETEIDENTRNILLESANFDLYSIRRTTQALRLPSEASQRFGRGIHPALPEPAARRAGELMRVLAGGTIARGLVDAYPSPVKPVVIDVTLGEIERSLGISFAADEVVRILESLEFVVEEGDGKALRVTVPDHRLDCHYPADVIEEVARMHGYDRIPLTQLADRLPPQRANRSLELEEQVRDILVGCGLQEVITYSLTTLAREASLFALPVPAHCGIPLLRWAGHFLGGVRHGTGIGEPGTLTPGTSAQELPSGAYVDYVQIANPITQERAVMRHHVLTTVLETAAANLRFREHVAVFEAGKVFLQASSDELPQEPLRLAIVMCGSPDVSCPPLGAKDIRCWSVAGGPDLDFYDLKGVVDTLLARLHVVGANYEPTEHPTFQPGRTARVLVRTVQVGVLGEIHPAVREAFELPDRRVAAAEFDLEALLAQVPAAWTVEPVSTYPAVLQDLAVVVGDQVRAAAVQGLIAEAGGFLLKQVRLFDVYYGEPVQAGKKSLAFGLTFQAPDKTLSDETVAKHVKRIVGRLSKELGAELRS